MVYYLSSLFPEHSKICALFNEDIFKCAVTEIIIGPKNNSDVFPLVHKLREQLERSSTELLSFLEACTRKIHKKTLDLKLSKNHPQYRLEQRKDVLLSNF